MESSQELYPGCKNFSKLRFLVRLHLKLLGGWTDKTFDRLLDLLKDAFPDGSTLPKNYNEAKKRVKCLGLGYASIHACENDCILFCKDHANADCCPTCETSRWKSEKQSLDGKRVHNVPNKVLRYFPKKRRLQRLFVSSRTATDMRWHDEERTKDCLLRHPADSPLWKDFDHRHPEFASDSRNIRLALATDGFNPFRSLNVSYSIWPVILIPYNFPPWMCVKQPNFILSLLIPGRKAPGSDMDNMLEEDTVVHRQVVAPRIPPRNIAVTTRNREASRDEDESLVGRDVILYAILRLDIPVAKATIVSTDPSTMVGGIALGREYYEVVVNVVLKRDVILPRPYAGMEIMADAHMMSIAWPCKKMNHRNKPSSSQSAGKIGRT